MVYLIKFDLILVCWYDYENLADTLMYVKEVMTVSEGTVNRYFFVDHGNQRVALAGDTAETVLPYIASNICDEFRADSSFWICMTRIFRTGNEQEISSFGVRNADADDDVSMNVPRGLSRWTARRLRWKLRNPSRYIAFEKKDFRTVLAAKCDDGILVGRCYTDQLKASNLGLLLLMTAAYYLSECLMMNDGCLRQAISEMFLRDDMRFMDIAWLVDEMLNDIIYY